MIKRIRTRAALPALSVDSSAGHRGAQQRRALRHDSEATNVRRPMTEQDIRDPDERGPDRRLETDIWTRPAAHEQAQRPGSAATAGRRGA